MPEQKQPVQKPFSYKNSTIFKVKDISNLSKEEISIAYANLFESDFGKIVVSDLSRCALVGVPSTSFPNAQEIEGRRQLLYYIDEMVKSSYKDEKTKKPHLTDIGVK